MVKKMLTVFLIAAFCVTMLPASALAARLEQTPLEKISVTEKILYGSEQDGSLVERTNKLERDLFGIPGREALMAKVDRIYSYVRDSSAGAPSLIFKMGALEWSLTQSVAKGPVKTRLETLERTVSGVMGTGPIDARIARLMTITFTNSRLQTGAVTLPKDTLVKIKMTAPLDSKRNKTGDAVDFEVAEDLYASGMLILPKGAPGKGKLAKVEQAQNFGRDAKMEVNFEYLEALDMTTVPTVLGEKAKKETESTATAAGAGFAGMILLGPIGVVGAAFVHGKNITIPAGTTLFIQTQNDVEMTGLIAK
jgi:hypothetical protein